MMCLAWRLCAGCMAKSRHSTNCFVNFTLSFKGHGYIPRGKNPLPKLKWSSLMVPCEITRDWCVNTLRQNGLHFPDDIFKCIFLNENVMLSIKFSLRFVPKGPINNIPALVEIMAWRRPGDKPLSEPMMVSLLTHICVTRPQWVKWKYFSYIWLANRFSKATLPVVIKPSPTEMDQLPCDLWI